MQFSEINQESKCIHSIQDLDNDLNWSYVHLLLMNLLKGYCKIFLVKFRVEFFFSLFQIQKTESLKCRSQKRMHLWDRTQKCRSFQGYLDPQMTLCCIFCEPRGVHFSIIFFHSLGKMCSSQKLVFKDSYLVQ